MTKDRVAPALAIVAAIVGLVLVFSGPHSAADGGDDDAPVAPPSTSQTAPAPGLPAPAPVGSLPPGAPQAPQDDDGDDDG